MDYLVGSNVIMRVLTRGRREAGGGSEKYDAMVAEVGGCTLKKEERARSPGVQVASAGWKGPGMVLPTASGKGHSPDAP